MNYKASLFFIFGMLLLLSSCSETPNGKTNIFHYNQSSGISSLDPAFSRDQATIWACNQLYNGLVQLDSNLNVQPCIAKTWETSPDGKTFTFHLRTDVVFHQNSCFSNRSRKVTASDFVYSFERLINKQTASPGAWIFNGRIDTVQPFEAINDSTFILRLKQPFPPILGILTMTYCSVVPKEAVEKYGTDFRSHPVGTGPFQFKVWKEGIALILTRNPMYFEFENGARLPLLDGVRVSFINNKKTEFLTFRSGQIDFISGIDASFIDEVLTDQGTLKPELTQQYNLQKAPYLNTEYLGFNLQTMAVWQNKKLRQAVNYAFDRQELIRYLRNGVGSPAEQGFCPRGLPNFDSHFVGFHYDPIKAQQLLAEAGYPNGKGLPVLKLYTNETYKEIGLFVARQLERSGIHVNLEIAQGAILREWMSQGKAPFFRGSWIADYPDAESYFTVFYGKNDAPPNYTRFKNATYDSLYEAALLTNDAAARFKIYQRLEEILIEEAPVVPLYYDEVLRFTSKRVHHLTPNGLNLLDLKRTTLN
ncbi:MAG: ABC transporter substrate-binding protein [Chitinophagales bacterium]